MSSNCEKTSSNYRSLVDNLLRCIEMVKSKHDGQYLDNIASVCADQLGWDRHKTAGTLQKAIELELIREVTTQGKTSYRCIQSAKIVIICDSVDEITENGLTLDSCPPESITGAIDESGNGIESQPSSSNSATEDFTHQYQCWIERDFHDFKEFVWGELASLRKHKSGSETGRDQIHYETAFIE